MKPSPWKWSDSLGAYALTCASTAEFLTAADFAPGTGHRCDSSRTGSRDFSETPSYTAAVELLRDGWPDGARQAAGMVAKLAPAIADADSAERHLAHFDAAGDEPDVDRYLAGEPENMLEFRPEPVPSFGRVAQVVFDGCVSGGVEAKHLMRAAVIVAALVDSLEATGVRAEFVVRYRHNNVADDGKKACELEHWVKRADQPLDLAKVVAAMHPAAFRRIMFRWCECLNGIDSGYGCVATSRRNTEPGCVALRMAELTPLLGDESRIGKWMADQRERLLA